jgi:protein O-mannosyl-transferase
MNTQVTSDFSKSWQASFWKSQALPLVLVFAIPILLYWPSLSFDYVLDDKIVISKNAFTQKGLAGVWDLLSKETFTGYFQEQKDLVVGGRYRPLSLVTFALEHQFFGLNPRISHGVNFLLYALTGILLYRILFLLYYRPLKGKMLWLFSVPLLGTLLFLLHPLHVEAVANIKGRDELMSLLGSLAALYFSLRFVFTGAARPFWWMSLSLFLACLSKENAITWVLVIPAALWVFAGANPRQLLRVVLGLGVPVLLYLLIRYQVIGYFLDSGQAINNLMNNPFAEMNGRQQYATIFYTLGMYLKLLVFPHPLTHDYYPYQIPIMDWNHPWVLLSLVAHLGLLVWGTLGVVKRNAWAFWVFYYWVTLSIVSNLFFTVGTFMNERFVYASSLGFCLILAKSAVYGLERGKGLWLGVLMGLVLAGYAFQTHQRLPAWKDTLALNEAAVKVSTGSARAQLFAGTALYNEKAVKMPPGEEKRKVLVEARDYVLKSLDIYPNYPDALTMLAGLAAGIYEVDRQLEPLLEDFARVLAGKPQEAYVYQYLAYLNRTLGPVMALQTFYYEMGYRVFQERYNHPSAALTMLELGLSVAPNNAQILWALAQINYRLGNQKEGDRYLLMARNIDPTR